MADGSDRGRVEVARKHFDDALRIDPNFVPALLGLAYLAESDVAGAFGADASTRAQQLAQFDKLTLRAVQADGTWWPSWFERSMALGQNGEWDQALEANTQARNLDDKSDSAIIDQQAYILIHLDRMDDALAVATQATRMVHQRGTSQEGFSQRAVCATDLFSGRYAEAVAACEKSAANDDGWLDAMYLTAAYAQLGDSAKAAAAKARLLAKKPDFTIEKARARNSGAPGFMQRADMHLYTGLRKAGVP